MMKTFTTIALFCLIAGTTGFAQTIVSVTPDSAQRGQCLELSIVGSGTNFNQVTTTTGGNIWIANGTDSLAAEHWGRWADTLLTADFIIPTNATTGQWDLNVYSPTDGLVSFLNGFKINPSDPPPPPPTLLLPVNGSHITDDHPFFDWSDAAYVASYDLEIATDSNFNNIVYQYNSLPAFPSERQYHYWQGLQDGKHYWRVRGENLAKIMGNWSAISSFDLTAVPKILDIQPEKGLPGEFMQVKITGESTHFASGTPTMVNYLHRGADTIPMSNFWTNKHDTLHAEFTIPTDAEVGLWNLTFYNALDSTFSVNNGFEVYNCDTAGCGILEGHVYFDINQNCTYDAGENTSANILLQLNPSALLITTDATGHFSIVADTGSYTLTLLTSNNLWNIACPASQSYPVTITSSGQTISNLDFGLEADTLCPDLAVSIGTNRLLRCFDNTYVVHYQNNGTGEADSVQLAITFDPSVVPQSSTKAWSAVQGTTYYWNLGTLNPGADASFNVVTNVVCDNNLGHAFAAIARMYPSSNCEAPDPAWDQSSVAVTGTCLGDSSLQFVIYNNGSGNMASSSQYRIFRNATLIQTNAFTLNAGDSTVIPITGDGSTYRIEADQSTGHPGNSKPRAFVEACHPDPAAWVLGYIATIAQDDADDFIDIDCREVVGSWDPNEKLVSPAGVLGKNYITNTDEMQYQINFQNTGTFMAFTVVIRDTLSEHLDIASVENGASSHENTFRIYGNRILEWTFNDINLPDSNSNEPGSHGFATFKVRQMPNNPHETVIDNKAGIVFDFNEPIVTNTVSNEIWDPAQQTSSIEVKETVAAVNVTAYPNPFSQSTTLLIEGPREQLQDLRVELYDILGRQLRSHLIAAPQHQNNQVSFEIDRGDLPTGIIIYKVMNARAALGSGKLVVQ